MFQMRKILFAVSIAMLAGCTTLGLNNSQSNGSVSTAVNQSFKLTMLGGSGLNMTSDGVARPVQVCIYVVRNPDWEVPLLRKQSTCIESSTDPNVLQSRRVLLAPLHMNHISLPMDSGRDAWLIMDPDFSRPAMDHSPYMYLINAKNNQLNVILNGNELFQNKLVGTESAFSTPQQNTATSQLERFKPLARQSVMNPSSINMQQQGQSMLWEEVSKTMDNKR